jgi:exopolyphosphatase/guanosine-5'-triphosphate,3'-diphosphate pyrophosphatase
VHPGRADVIGAGALVLDGVVEVLGADELIVSECDILDGLVADLVR